MSIYPKQRQRRRMQGKIDHCPAMEYLRELLAVIEQCHDMQLYSFIPSVAECEIENTTGADGSPVIHQHWLLELNVLENWTPGNQQQIENHLKAEEVNE